MKRIFFMMLLSVITGNGALAGNGADFTGQWIVASEDFGESGITVNVDDRSLLVPPLTVETGRTVADANLPQRAVDFIQNREFDKMRQQYEELLHQEQATGKSTAFTVVSSGTFFEFVANGTQLTGSKIHGKTEEPIFNGKINGNKITFTVKETVAGKPYSYSYTGELSDDGIQFEVRPQRDAGDRFKFKVIRRGTR